MNKGAKKFLVTGGAGFIGGHLCEKLLTLGHQVICLDNLDNYYPPELKKKTLKRLSQSSSFEWIEGDIRSEQTLKTIFSQHPSIDAVVHLAARAGVRPSIQDPALYYDVNVTGTLKLLEAMKAAGCKRLLFASSSSVYGNNPKIPFSEADFVDHPISPYAATKKTGELMCHVYHHLHGFDIFCLRFFTVYGPRQRPEMAISQFANKILKNETISLFGDGSSLRDYTYCEDIVNGLVRSLDRLKGFEVLNLGGSKMITLSEMVQTIEAALGKKAIVQNLQKQPGDVERTCADPQKALEVLGFQSETSFSQGVHKFCQWLSAEGLEYYRIS